MKEGYVVMKVIRTPSFEKGVFNYCHYLPFDKPNQLSEHLWIHPTRVISEDELKRRILKMTAGDYREGDIEILFALTKKGKP